MRKLLILFSLTATLALNGCSTLDAGLSAVPRLLGADSLVYQPVILQGNIVTQEQVNQLKPGMSRTQVQHILGTPTLQDTFHADRWDYPYTKGTGSSPEEIAHLTVYFEQDRLAGLEGELEIQPEAEQEPPRRAAVVKVPDWSETESPSFWSRIFD